MTTEPTVAPPPEPQPSVEQIDTKHLPQRQRLNVAVNVQAWAHLPDAQRDILTWWHQYVLEQGMTWQDAAESIGYSTSTVSRVLRGVYEGSWDEICAAIASYRRVEQERGQVQKQEFVETRASKLVHGALAYALANNSITMIEGESRTGKTLAATVWRDANNHGRSVYVIAPAYGGVKALLREIAKAVGANRDGAAAHLVESICRAFNRQRILIIDEAHRLLPSEGHACTALEIVRDLHDRTGCAVALISTARFQQSLRRTEYMYEQLLGRIELPVRIPRQIERTDIEKILRQYIAEPNDATVAAASRIANEKGRLGTLVGVLKVASRMARGVKRGVSNELFAKSIKLREQMMGETQYAA